MVRGTPSLTAAPRSLPSACAGSGTAGATWSGDTRVMIETVMIEKSASRLAALSRGALLDTDHTRSLKLLVSLRSQNSIAARSGR